MSTYTLSAPLVQAMVDVINQQPARQVRELLNLIEAECKRQDDAAAQAERERREAELRAEWLAQQQPVDPPAAI